jgi:glutamate racemase
MKIGVFDSGVGGLSVANAIQKAIPDQEVLMREDKQHVPYGTRQPAEILAFVTPILKELVDSGCQVIVIACNTVSTTLIKELRRRFTVELIAVEPMIKLAAKLTRSNVITVCATPTTLASARYQHLKKRYAKGTTVLEPDCHDWSHMIEHKQVNEQKVRVRIEATLDKGSDVIVLGCTHYHWIEQRIKDIVDTRAQILQPEPIVVAQLKRLLAQL